MQVNNFITYLEAPLTASTISENEIKPLLKEFPYCQTGQMIHAVQLKGKNSILFDEQLKKAAAYCTDRHQLFKHLHPEVEIKNEIKQVESLKPFAVKKLAPTLEVKETVQKENVSLPEKEAMDSLEREYLSAAVSSTILLEAEEDILTTTPFALNKQEAIVEVDQFNEKKGHSFGDWLKYYSEEEKSIKTPIRFSIESNKQDLIDKFIQEDPKIKPIKTEFYSPTNMARLSVVDDSDIVSETLALVYVGQGKYQDAIKAYKKLSLKNPEKRSYFVDQIKILNQKIK